VKWSKLKSAESGGTPKKKVERKEETAKSTTSLRRRPGHVEKGPGAIKDVEGSRRTTKPIQPNPPAKSNAD